MLENSLSYLILIFFNLPKLLGFISSGFPRIRDKTPTNMLLTVHLNARYIPAAENAKSLTEFCQSDKLCIKVKPLRQDLMCLLLETVMPSEVNYVTYCRKLIVKIKFAKLMYANYYLMVPVLIALTQILSRRWQAVMTCRCKVFASSSKVFLFERINRQLKSLPFLYRWTILFVGVPHLCNGMASQWFCESSDCQTF